MTLPHLNLTFPVTAAVVGVLVLYGLGVRERGQQARNDVLDARVAATLTNSKGQHRLIDSVTARSRRTDSLLASDSVERQRTLGRVVTALRAADSAKSETEQLREILAQAPTQTDTVRVQTALITDLTLERDTLRFAVNRFQLTVQIDSMDLVRLAGDRDRWKATALAGVTSLDSAIATLKAVNQVRDCHILGIGLLPRCPSRIVAATMGAGILELLHLLTGRA